METASDKLWLGIGVSHVCYFQFTVQKLQIQPTMHCCLGLLPLVVFRSHLKPEPGLERVFTPINTIERMSLIWLKNIFNSVV